jgi:hypothetical protein
LVLCFGACPSQAGRFLLTASGTVAEEKRIRKYEKYMKTVNDAEEEEDSVRPNAWCELMQEE